MAKKKPEEQALSHTLREWHQAIAEEEKIGQAFLKDALQAIFEGLISLDERFTSLALNDWKYGSTIIAFQDELNLMRYKMMTLAGEKSEK